MNKKKTFQMDIWSGDFGKEYTNRNPQSLEEMQQKCMQVYGKTRKQINMNFLDDLHKNMRILEVGSNIGLQLLCLQDMGFENLYGIELQSYAVEIAKTKTKNINIIQGTGFDIPFKDNYFDLVYTSGVLIHIAPVDILHIMKEMYRVSNKFIWGFEYYADQYQELNYRDNNNLMWKTNFANLFLDNFENLKLVKREKYKYIDNENVDEMYLLEKY